MRESRGKSARAAKYSTLDVQIRVRGTAPTGIHALQCGSVALEVYVSCAWGGSHVYVTRCPCLDVHLPQPRHRCAIAWLGPRRRGGRVDSQVRGPDATALWSH